jgi:dTDP-4-amino-4,6-dideoxygalactose transaminase
MYAINMPHHVTIPMYHEKHMFHLFPIRVDADKRDKIIDYLLANGISAGVHYKPLTYYPMYSDQSTPPVTEREWKRLISLPIFYDMTDEQVEYVCDKVKESVKIC